MLFGGAQAAVQRQHLGAFVQSATADAAANRLFGIPNLGFTREEYEHVAVAFEREFVERVIDALEVVAVGAVRGLFFGVVCFQLFGNERAVANLDRIGAARHFNDRCVVEVLREALGIDRGARDDDAEVGASGPQLLEVAKQEVDRETALVGLVDDDRVILLEVAVSVNFVEQNAVGHELHASVLAHTVGESHLVTDEVTHLGSEFFRNALGNCSRRNPSRLRVPDGCLAEFQQNLG